jgi:hypothetical protein
MLDYGENPIKFPTTVMIWVKPKLPSAAAKLRGKYQAICHSYAMGREMIIGWAKGMGKQYG